MKKGKKDVLDLRGMLTIQNKDPKNITCTFSGDLGISSIEDIYTLLQQLELSFSTCRCSVSDVNNIDLSFFQMIYAFGKKLSNLGKEISFELILDEEYQRIYQRSGLEDAFGKLLEK